MGAEKPEITIEISTQSGFKIIVSGSGGAESLANALREGLAAVNMVIDNIAELKTLSTQKEKRFPAELLSKVSELNSKDLVLLLLYFEGPISREQINQRSKEIGKEVSKTWLDSEFFRKPTKDLFVAETGPEGAKLYRLSEIGRLEAEKLLARLSTS